MRLGVWIAALAIGCSPKGEDPPVDPPTPEPPVVVPLVRINEVMAGNKSTWNGFDGASFPDWIELVNLDEEPIALSRLELRNRDGASWRPTEGTLLPGQRLVIAAHEPLTADDPWTGFTLSKKKDLVALFVDGHRADTVEFEEVPNDVSVARTPDATGEFALTAWPSPGLENPDAPSPTLDPADAFVFRTDKVHKIHFHFTQQAYQQIDQNSRPEVDVGLEIDGVYWKQVGLKLKGSASYDKMSGKPAFNVDMKEWVSGQRFRGLKRFNLHNGKVLDPTRVRDHITYRLAREAGLLAPRVGWAEVWCNHVYYGLYVIVERHDDIFLEYRFPGEEQGELGLLFEPNEPRDGGWGWGDWGQGDLNWKYENGPMPPTQGAVDAMQAADDLIAGPATDAAVEALWERFDREGFLTYLAWETVTSHNDGYKAPNNWRVFVHGTDFDIHLVPGGAEWTWDMAVQAWTFGGKAASWCLSNAGCKRAYAERVLEVADLAEDLDLLGEFQALSQWLDPLIQADPRYTGWQTVPAARATTLDSLTRSPGLARNQVYQAYPDLRP